MNILLIAALAVGTLNTSSGVPTKPVTPTDTTAFYRSFTREFDKANRVALQYAKTSCDSPEFPLRSLQLRNELKTFTNMIDQIFIKESDEVLRAEEVEMAHGLILLVQEENKDMEQSCTKGN
jgi:hypothetical protein